MNTQLKFQIFNGAVAFYVLYDAEKQAHTLRIEADATNSIELSQVQSQALARALLQNTQMGNVFPIDSGMTVIKSIELGPPTAYQIEGDLLRLGDVVVSGDILKAFESSALISTNILMGNPRIETNVFIGLPQEHLELFDIERIQNAVGDFMEAMGFELETKDEPVFGSFFQDLKYFFKGRGKAAAAEALQKGKLALETQHITLPAAEATGKLAESAAALISSLNGVDEAVLRLGSLLVVKVSRNGLPAIMAETVSPELAQLLDKNPGLLKTPAVLFDMLSAMQAPVKKIGGGEAGIIEA
ncbi:hypothetical protein Q5H92_21795 [Hymenobacter sp. M29]|uniref:Uncharacterized protein n=1 Tax=Hymenobacter mellowenesis TaxID=3063995 RepID=A0ABT9AGL7_9BACT|nr:hypothetical protein [Hymenobacter sp. M29]MDO7849013.1 hypothetical protein [Hymenobacter sp. M29]